MPLVIVYGIDQEKADVNTLIKTLREKVAQIPELTLTEDQVSVFVPRDVCGWESPDIIAMVEGLFNKPERTAGVRQRLADVIGNTIVEWAKNELTRSEGGLMDSELVEVLVKRFDPQADGFFQHKLQRSSS